MSENLVLNFSVVIFYTFQAIIKQNVLATGSEFNQRDAMVTDLFDLNHLTSLLDASVSALLE
ncbi:MAG: hypothetical protein WBN96_10415 [Gammaproteobacteria bacterium]